MLSYIKKNLSSKALKIRLVFTFILFIILFLGLTILSYYLLPEGILKNKNPLQNWKTADHTLVLTLQIFFYNMLSVIIILLGSLFGQKKDTEKNYLSIGYLAFFVVICQNAVVLGTWSFSIDLEAVSLSERIFGTFDVVHRAGIWEMIGQLFITCAVAHIATILTSGKTTTYLKLRDIHLRKSEKLLLITGLVFMLTGAIVESLAILAF